MYYEFFKRVEIIIVVVVVVETRREINSPACPIMAPVKRHAVARPSEILVRFSFVFYQTVVLAGLEHYTNAL